MGWRGGEGRVSSRRAVRHETGQAMRVLAGRGGNGQAALSLLPASPFPASLPPPISSHAPPLPAQVITVDLPSSVELEVVATDPGVRGNTASGETLSPLGRLRGAGQGASAGQACSPPAPGVLEGPARPASCGCMGERGRKCGALQWEADRRGPAEQPMPARRSRVAGLCLRALLRRRQQAGDAGDGRCDPGAALHQYW